MWNISTRDLCVTCHLSHAFGSLLFIKYVEFSADFAQFSPEPEIPGALPNAPELGVGMGKKHTLGVGSEIERNFSFEIVLKNSFKKF